MIPKCDKCKSELVPCNCYPIKLPVKASDTQVQGTHYKSMIIQPAEFCQKNKLGWCESNVIKYVCRHKNKNGLQDIEKAIHYLQLLKEWEYPNNG